MSDRNCLAWEREVMDLLSARLNIPNGDAQGLFEVNAIEMAREWTNGSSASDTANRLINT